MRGLAIAISACAACSFSTSVSLPKDGSIVEGEERMIDGPPIDVDPNVCSTAGLVCATPVVMIACSGACWVGCRESTEQPVAKQRCVAWGGTLARMDSAAEQTCVNSSFAGTARWLGIEQAAGSGLVAENWLWDGITAPAYLSWAGGQPNDFDGAEDGDEQCAYMSNPSGTWQDTPCMVPSGAFVCRR